MTRNRDCLTKNNRHAHMSVPVQENQSKRGHSKRTTNDNKNETFKKKEYSREFARGLERSEERRVGKEC